MLRIWKRGRQWIVQYRRRLVEVDSVLLPVCSGLGWIPSENHGRIIWPIVLRAFPGLLTLALTCGTSGVPLAAVCKRHDAKDRQVERVVRRTQAKVGLHRMPA